ncbi:MAG: transglutaminase family protein [Pirellulales bacterium]|nr:transglutaminase family protein [Pirellulales bacterium]
MPIRVALFHETSYRYDRPILLGPHLVRLKPAPHTRTPVISYSLKVEPREHFLNWQQDPQSNFVARVVFPDRVPELRVVVDLVAEMSTINPFDFFLEPDAEEFPFTYNPWQAPELAPFLVVGPGGPRLDAWIASIDRKPRKTVDFLVELNQRLHGEVDYLVRLEPGVQEPERTLELGSGSCRDSAWLLVQVLRRLGIAARFVSGYLIQLKPDVKSLDGPSGTEHDFTDLHAWCEAYLPGAGWVGLDPTSGLLTGEGHIPLAATPEPLSAAPISGSLEACEADFEHVMRITRVHEDPRVTKPYTEQQWRDIDALGHRVDRYLVEQDVRLTMGGEPTFISIDDMDGPEWNTAAAGPHKRQLSEVLIRRLSQRFAPGGLLHFGQGKWYPGEQLPRWALACYWRKDGHPIWNDPGLIAAADVQYGFGIEDAERFVEVLAQRLAVDPGYAVPAFEDPVHFLHREGQLPVNVDPAENKLEDPEERRRLRRVFERGLNEPVGFVLPLTRAGYGNDVAWESGLWMLRSKHLLLIPGDSPIGLRLPVGSLPWVSRSEYPYLYSPDPLHAWQNLPPPQQMQWPALNLQRRERERGQTALAEDPNERVSLRDRMPKPRESAHWVVRTALCVEPREGRLHVFLPPVGTTEEYLSLVAAIEDTAAALQMPVIVEGELPPFDPRLGVFKVTPDPGVIEVNVPPGHSWDDLKALTTGLYEEARLSRLGTEKFMLDGRHSGTGGGNHVVLGGPSPADSPFLRRPDLLRSLVVYWLNHPSLSYLFSGLFVGPTSQAPRVDEARHETVYELEIACEELDRLLRSGQHVPAWLVDRIFRHLLTDLTGNTHRSEFCIDKLYSPDTATGRLGLVEFRAFEMPPHAQMSLTQQLLLRTLVAWFWRTPYRARPIRWGTQLHDRFLLPHFVWQDFGEVMRDLGDAGFDIEAGWFLPHFEFRFPVLGRVQCDGIEIELRQAIEPWHVLGEQPGAGGTVRFVDSSVERLQVRVAGGPLERYAVLCNGRKLPLVPTPTPGESVAGVRYRAWQPPNCLHPTLGIDTPLVFDLYDHGNERSLGGCTYHVASPNGRNYDTFPVNAMEAESRRNARFFAEGHTPGWFAAPLAEHNAEFPCTLDLRRGR